VPGVPQARIQPRAAIALQLPGQLGRRNANSSRHQNSDSLYFNKANAKANRRPVKRGRPSRKAWASSLGGREGAIVFAERIEGSRLLRWASETRLGSALYSQARHPKRSLRCSGEPFGHRLGSVMRFAEPVMSQSRTLTNRVINEPGNALRWPTTGQQESPPASWPRGLGVWPAARPRRVPASG
jgi:hypothetical protein